MKNWEKVIWKKAGNMLRTRQTRAFANVPLEDVENAHSTYNNYNAVDSPSARCSELLSAEEFGLLRRIVMEGEPYPSVAADLGLTERACRKRIERILKKLRENWDQEK